MISPIRLATAEEIKQIEANSDLGPGCVVYAQDQADGEPSIAVMRTCVELDPVYEPNLRKKLLLKWGLETYMRLSGVPAYYFNIHADDEEYKAAAEKAGCRIISTAPEYRFKVTL